MTNGNAAEVHAGVIRIFRWAARGQAAESLRTGLTAMDAWLLRSIADLGPIRLSDLAAEHGVDRSTVSPQVRRLEERGLVQRTQDPADRRAWDLEVTAEARTLLAGLAEARSGIADAVLAGWNARDRATLGRLLTRFAEDLERYDASVRERAGE